MSGGWSCPATHSFYVHPHSSLTSLCLLQNEKKRERESELPNRYVDERESDRRRAGR